MAIYSGKITDFGLAPISGLTPQAWVQAVNEAFGPASEFLAATRKPLTVNPATGIYTVSLVPSLHCSPPTDYTIGVTWLEANGTPRGESSLRFTAAIGGGAPGDMTGEPVFRFYNGPTAPESPDTGNIWLDSSAPWSYQFKRWSGMSWISVGAPIEGPPGTIDKIKVTPIAAGSTASATVGGTPGNREADFKIPVVPGGLTPAEQANVDAMKTRQLEVVSGTVTLPASAGDSVRQFYTSGATQFVSGSQRLLASTGTTIVFRRTPAGVWGYALVDTWTGFDGFPTTSGGVYSSARASALKTLDVVNYWPLHAATGTSLVNFGSGAGLTAGVPKPMTLEGGGNTFLAGPAIGDGPASFGFLGSRFARGPAVITGYTSAASFGFVMKMPASGAAVRGVLESPAAVTIQPDGKLRVVVAASASGPAITLNSTSRVDTDIPVTVDVTLSTGSYKLYINAVKEAETAGQLTPPGSLGMTVGLGGGAFAGLGYMAGAYFTNTEFTAAQVLTVSQATGTA